MLGYYLGIDQGTTNTTAVLADENWRVAAKASRTHQQIYPQPGWVEHDPEEVLSNILAVTLEAIAKTPGADIHKIKAVGLDHQGETCVIWDKATGKCIYLSLIHI